MADIDRRQSSEQLAGIDWRGLGVACWYCAGVMAVLIIGVAIVARAVAS